MKNEKFTLSSRIRSFGFAWKGLKIMFKNEHNFRIHTFATSLVIIAGICFGISFWEWLIIALTIAFVMVTEILNTAIEYICDYLTEEHDIRIGVIKDIAAAAVLVSAIGAAIVGVLIFGRQIFILLT